MGVFSKQDIVKIAFLAITNWIVDVGVRRPAGLGVLEAGLGGLERHLGDSCVLLNGLGRFQNALGTFQNAPERESLIFQWFWEVLAGGPQGRACARHLDGWIVRPPKTQFQKKTPNTHTPMAIGKWCLDFG